MASEVAGATTSLMSQAPQHPEDIMSQLNPMPERAGTLPKANRKTPWLRCTRRAGSSWRHDCGEPGVAIAPETDEVYCARHANGLKRSYMGEEEYALLIPITEPEAEPNRLRRKGAYERAQQQEAIDRAKRAEQRAEGRRHAEQAYAQQAAEKWVASRATYRGVDYAVVHREGTEALEDGRYWASDSTQFCVKARFGQRVIAQSGYSTAEFINKAQAQAQALQMAVFGALGDWRALDEDNL